MRTFIICLLVLSCWVVSPHAHSQNTVISQPGSVPDLQLLESCDGYLRSAVRYNAVVNTFEIVGGTLLGLGLHNESGGFGASGFLLGFGGMEMSKSTPIPLTKARRYLDLLDKPWKDSLGYAQVYLEVSTAETFGYATMALAFIGQGLFLAGAFTNSEEDGGTILMWAGAGCAIASFGTSVATTILTSRARVDLGKLIGSLGIGVGPDGIGAVYKLP